MINKKIRYLIMGALMLLFCSIPYSWSMLVIPLNESFGWSPEAMGKTFSIGIASFCIGSMLSGIMQKEIKKVFLLGNLSLIAGFFLLATLDSIIKLYLGFGLFLCLGAGILYNAGLSRVLSFFPAQQGFISGILLMCFGFGSSVVGGLVVFLHHFLNLPMVFSLLGVLIIAVQITGMLLLTGRCQNLEPNQNQNMNQIPDINQHPSISQGLKEEKGAAKVYDSTSSMVRSISFWCYFLWASSLSSAALIVIGNATMLAASLDDRTYIITMSAGLISVFNGLGRIISGWLLDRIGSRRIFILLTGGFAVSAMLLYFAARITTIVTLMMSYCLFGLSYGGIFPCNSTYIRTIFGQRKFAIHFSIINLSLLIAGFIGPWLAAFVINGGGVPVSYLLLAITVAAAVCLTGIKQHISKQQKGKKYEVFNTGTTE